MTIVSSDKDLMQLIRPGVDMLDPIKQKPIGPAEVMEKFGVTPDKMIEVQSLIGDSTDNVPGRARHRPEGRGAADQRIRRSRSGAGGGPGDEALEASRHADRARGQGAHVPRTGGAARGCAAAVAVGCAGGAASRTRRMLAAWLATQGFRSTIAPAGPGRPRRRAGRSASEAPVEAPPAVPLRTSPFGRTDSRSRPWRPCAPGLMPRRAAGCVRAGYRNRWAGRDASQPGRPVAGDRRRPRLLRAVASRRWLAEQVPWLTPIAVLGRCSPIPSVLKILQNAKFDMMVLARAGFPPITPIDDTMLISYAQEAGAHGHGMDELSRLHLGHTPIPYDEVTGTGRNRISFAPCRSTARPPTRRRTPTSRCACGTRLKPRLRGQSCAGAVRAGGTPPDARAARHGARGNKSRRR